MNSHFNGQICAAGMHRCPGSKTWRCCSSWNVQNAFWYSQREPIDSFPLWLACMFKPVILIIYSSPFFKNPKNKNRKKYTRLSQIVYQYSYIYFLSFVFYMGKTNVFFHSVGLFVVDSLSILFGSSASSTFQAPDLIYIIEFVIKCTMLVINIIWDTTNSRDSRA